MKKKTIVGWTLYSGNLKNIIHWREGANGCEFAEIDHMFKNIRTLKDMWPRSMRDRLIKVKLTIEQLKEGTK